MRPVIPQTNNGFICIPVTARAEAEVYQIPFDGSTTYFVDVANGKIYAETFNAANGTAPLIAFSKDAHESSGKNDDDPQCTMIAS